MEQILSDKKSGLQHRIQSHSSYNTCGNCQSHGLGSCQPHLMKNPEFAGSLLDYDTLFLVVWMIFIFCL